LRFLNRERCKAAVHSATRIAWLYRSRERVSIPFQVKRDGVAIEVAIAKISNPYAGHRIAAALLGRGLTGNQRETDDHQGQEKFFHISKSYHARRDFSADRPIGNKGARPQKR